MAKKAKFAAKKDSLPMLRKYRGRLPSRPAFLSSRFEDEQTNITFKKAWGWIKRQEKHYGKTIWLHTGSGAMVAGPRPCFLTSEPGSTLRLSARPRTGNVIDDLALFLLFRAEVRPPFAQPEGSMLAPCVTVRGPLLVRSLEVCHSVTDQQELQPEHDQFDLENESIHAEDRPPHGETVGNQVEEMSRQEMNASGRDWPPQLTVDQSAFSLCWASETPKLKMFAPADDQKRPQWPKKRKKAWPMLPGQCYIL